MPLTITLRDGEPFEVALQRFRNACHFQLSQRWTHARRGYYEPPSVLRRKRRTMRRLRQRFGSLWLHIPLQAQWARHGPNHSAGR